MPSPFSSTYRNAVHGLSLALLILPACAHAQTATTAATDSHVATVKLYPGSATVERVLTVTPGTRQARFTCLPAHLDPASVQVSGSAGILVGELAIRQQPREFAGSACASPLDARIRKLQDDIAAVDAESAGIDYASGYLKSWSRVDDNAHAAASPSTSIADTATALRQSGRQLLTRQHQLQRQRQALERELKPLLAERDRSGGQNAPVSTVQVTLAAPQGGELSLKYQMHGPGWQPGYRATLNTETGRLQLARLAQVVQNTGEDWRNVRITLSTGQPGAATQAPLPRPWRIGIEHPEDHSVRSRKLDAAPMAAMRAPAMLNEASDAAATPQFEVDVVQGSFATEFVVPQRVSVPAGGQQVTLTLDEQAIEARLLARATPALDPNAYLIASFDLPTGVWPAGRVGLYRDGAFVGHGHFDADDVARNGLAFGRDDRVRVRAERPEQQRGTKGLLGGQNQRVDARRYTVENRHDRAIELQLLDAAPVSTDEDVRIQSAYQPEPQTRHWHDRAGTVAWQQPLAAGATQDFTATHTIRWPKDKHLQER